MDPADGVRNLVSRLKQVVLPAPLGPISACTECRRTRRSTDFTATKPRKSLVRPWVWRMCSVVIAEAAWTDARRTPGLTVPRPRTANQAAEASTGALGVR